MIELKVSISGDKRGFIASLSSIVIHCCTDKNIFPFLPRKLRQKEMENMLSSETQCQEMFIYKTK